MNNVKKIIGYIFLILLAFIFIFPLIWMVVSSMKTEESIYLDLTSIKSLLPSFNMSDWFTSYAKIFSRFNVFGYLSNSMIYAVIVTAGSIIVNAMAGFAFA